MKDILNLGYYKLLKVKLLWIPVLYKVISLNFWFNTEGFFFLNWLVECKSKQL